MRTDGLVIFALCILGFLVTAYIKGYGDARASLLLTSCSACRGTGQVSVPFVPATMLDKK